jgi:hypothetical protein
MAGLLHIPLDFDRRETLRLLARKFSLTVDTPTATERALVYGLRIWMEWGASGKQLRPLTQKYQGDPTTHPWSRENITFVLEDAARWAGNSGDLISELLAVGFLIVADHGDGKASLTLEGFWALNEHLSPDYKTLQQRGGLARTKTRELEKLSALATERRKIFDTQGFLPFGSEKPTESEQEASYALFMRLHRECGLELPKAEDFTEDNMSKALAVIRRFTPPEMATVEQWIVDHVGDVDFVKSPTRILETFATYLSAASGEVNPS